LNWTRRLAALALIAPVLSACATQQAMTVIDGSTAASANPKYRNAVVVRSVTGGRQ
jgi:hypothetical protein